MSRPNLLSILSKDEDIIADINRFFDIDAINQSIKVNLKNKPVSTKLNKSTVGSCFDYYFKFLLWEYLDSIKHYNVSVGDWCIPMFYAINPDYKITTSNEEFVREAFEELDEVISSNLEDKYAILAWIAHDFSYLKAARYKQIELPEISAEMQYELTQLGNLINFMDFNIKAEDKVLLTPKLRADFGRTFHPDIVIGSTIIDIKTYDKAVIKKKDIIQLLCYLAISDKSPVYSAYSPEDNQITNDFGIYFSRHGYYWQANLKTLLSDKNIIYLFKMLYKKLRDSPQY